jgi:type I restriction enzyme S subunit
VQVELDLADVWGVPVTFVKREDQFLVDGDLLVSSANSWNLVGKCCWVPPLPWRATFGGFISVLRADRGRLDPRYLYHWFSSANVQAIVRSFGQQTTNISNLNVERCLRLEVPLPTLNEQRRIAAVLDQAAALRAKRRAALAHLDTLAQSIFLDMFGDPATNPKGWPVRTLGDVAETMSGGTPKRDVGAYYGGGIPWVKSGELRQDLIVQTEESLTSRGLAESSAKLMPVGTVLVAMYGATVGAVSVLGVEAATNQAVCCIRPTPALQTTYLTALLRAMASSLIAKRVGGAQPNLSQELIRGLRIPVPPADEQAAFHDCIRKVGGLAVRHREAQDRIEAIFGSLQCRAFTGAM